MDPSHPIPKLDSIAQRWQAALLQSEPNLPRPVIDAMVQNVAKGSLGESLSQLEAGLMRLQEIDAETLTGSEIRTLLAILTHMRRQAEQIQVRLRQLWSTTD